MRKLLSFILATVFLLGLIWHPILVLIGKGGCYVWNQSDPSLIAEQTASGRFKPFYIAEPYTLYQHLQGCGSDPSQKPVFYDHLAPFGEFVLYYTGTADRKNAKYLLQDSSGTMIRITINPCQTGYIQDLAKEQCLRCKPADDHDLRHIADCIQIHLRRKRFLVVNGFLYEYYRDAQYLASVSWEYSGYLYSLIVDVPSFSPGMRDPRNWLDYPHPTDTLASRLLNMDTQAEAAAEIMESLCKESRTAGELRRELYLEILIPVVCYAGFGLGIAVRKRHRKRSTD